MNHDLMGMCTDNVTEFRLLEIGVSDDEKRTEETDVCLHFGDPPWAINPRPTAEMVINPHDPTLFRVADSWSQEMMQPQRQLRQDLRIEKRTRDRWAQDWFLHCIRTNNYPSDNENSDWLVNSSDESRD